MKITSPVGWLKLPDGAFLLLGIFCLVVVLCQPISGAGSRSWLNLGSNYFLKGEYESAYGCYREALLLDKWVTPERRQLVIFNLALVCSKLERFEESLCYFMESVRIGRAGESIIPRDEVMNSLKQTIKNAGGKIRITRDCLP